jgi:predicted acylesterase/phospholipase RssA
MPKPKHLVFAGGGPRCLSFLGALEQLDEKRNGLFNKVSDYWGNSAGALLATFLSLKAPLPKLRVIFEKLDFTRFRDIDLTNIVTFSEKWGLDSGDAFTKHIKELLENIKSGSSQYTLQEVPGLHITTADLTDNKMVVLDGNTFPTLKLVDALRATTSLPFFYRPFRNPINNHLYVDGAIGVNFPWVFLPSDKDREWALGFNFKNYHISNEPKTLTEFIPKIINFRESCSGNKQYVYPPNVIVFNVQGFPAWHLAVNDNDRDELFAIGKTTADEWLTHFAEEKTKTPNESAPQNTLLSSYPSSELLSGNPLHQRPLYHRDLSQDLPSSFVPAFRRWSV